jgi:hypothetical protein
MDRWPSIKLAVALGLAALAAAGTTAVAQDVEVAADGEAEAAAPEVFWVQTGAFDREKSARVACAMLRQGEQSFVALRDRAAAGSGGSVFVCRSPRAVPRAAAVALAERLRDRDAAADAALVLATVPPVPSHSAPTANAAGAAAAKRAKSPPAAASAASFDPERQRDFERSVDDREQRSAQTELRKVFEEFFDQHPHALDSLMVERALSISGSSEGAPTPGRAAGERSGTGG